ncbi:hypothetical protein [Streptomyces sp. NPDC059649]|uniref:hypothetical protein n=1 Tax=Streptomyces sp. NPDC059649 TaxID=3346895 RepID=UPI0036C2CC6D
MRKSTDRTGRGLVCAPAAWALPAALSSAAAAPAAPRESARIPSAERRHVTRHGGISRAANSSPTCAAATRGTARGGATARTGGAGADGRYRTAYAEVTGPVRSGGAGGRTVARVDVAVDRSRAGAWGGRTDLRNPTVTEFGQESARPPAARRALGLDRHTLGLDSEVFGRRPALRSGGDRLTFRFSARRPGYPPGALFVRTDTRR